MFGDKPNFAPNETSRIASLYIPAEVFEFSSSSNGQGGGSTHEIIRSPAITEPPHFYPAFVFTWYPPLLQLSNLMENWSLNSSWKSSQLTVCGSSKSEYVQDLQKDLLDRSRTKTGYLSKVRLWRTQAFIVH